MADIAVLGLGKMGSALAWSLAKAGKSVVVWNRSAPGMQPFQDAGIACAADPRRAIGISPVVVVCIDTYASTKAMLGDPDTEVLLRGRSVVQLGTGTPAQAREAADWMTQRGVQYLDGAILCGPESIGRKSARILLSGSETGYTKARPLIRKLAQDTRYLGEDPGAASALDLAWLCNRYGTFVAATHAASLCLSEGVPIDEMIKLEPDRPDIRKYAAVIRDGTYADSTATLDVWAAALDQIRTQGREAGMNTEFPDFCAGLFQRAQAAGYGQDNVMSLLKVLRDIE
jgi:3-hydroxyisobutyrate dehydrogenase-like beta-hydroxyacid dehydrogenase